MANQQKSVYTFIVAPDATKPEVKHSVEKAFNVKVEDVRTVKVKGKYKRMKNQLLQGKRRTGRRPTSP